MAMKLISILCWWSRLDFQKTSAQMFYVVSVFSGGLV